MPREPANDPNQKVKGGWSQSGTLQQFSVSQRVSMQADFPKSTYYTAQFSIIPPSSLAMDMLGYPAGQNVFGYRATATFRVSVEGNLVTRLVDIGNGTAVSFPGQGVKIVIQDETTLDFAFPLVGTVTTVAGSPDIVFSDPQTLAEGTLLFLATNEQIYTVTESTTASLDAVVFPPVPVASAGDHAFIAAIYTVTVQLSEGTRPNPEVPPTLLGLQSTLIGPTSAGPGVSAITVQIPQGVGVNSVEVVGVGQDVGTGDNDLPLNVTVTHNTGNSAGKSYNPVVPIFRFEALAPNATSVTVQNNDPTNPALVTITWGIDG